jgi:trehalose/maltose hydrolase-like predicted phosphorylase
MTSGSPVVTLPACEGIREALCALGNGYFATRGAAAWARADERHYPGTYLAGGTGVFKLD